jgi:hypothetical protein
MADGARGHRIKNERAFFANACLRRCSPAAPAPLLAEIVAGRLEDSGFVVMKRPPEIGAAALGRGFEG